MRFPLPPPSLPNPNHILRCGSSCWQGHASDCVERRCGQQPQQSAAAAEPAAAALFTFTHYCWLVTRAVVRDSRELVRHICWTVGVAFRRFSDGGRKLRPLCGSGQFGRVVADAFVYTTPPTRRRLFVSCLLSCICRSWELYALTTMHF